MTQHVEMCPAYPKYDRRPDRQTTSRQQAACDAAFAIRHQTKMVMQLSCYTELLVRAVWRSARGHHAAAIISGDAVSA